MAALSHVCPQQHSTTNGLGLLITVAQLPHKYRSRYLNLKARTETPLDLSVKLISPSDQINAHNCLNNSELTFTPPLSPRSRQELSQASYESSRSLLPALSIDGTTIDLNSSNLESINIIKKTEVDHQPSIIHDTTPLKPIKCDLVLKTSKSRPPSSKPNRNKVTRKLKFDEDTSSPVSGTIIRPLEEINQRTQQYSNGDIDPMYNIVEISEQTKAELAAIKNVIGDYVCKLCRIKFDDAFGLAQHRCSCIVLLEYRCPECSKQFNCPANLASHRRWHKPKKMEAKKENQDQYNKFTKSQNLCEECGKCFKRAAYLRKHKYKHRKQITDQATEVKGNTNAYNVGIDHQSTHSNEDEGIYTNYYDIDSMTDCSLSCGRLQIVEHNLTEEENIAAAALANLRNCTSVISTVIAMAH